MLLLPIIKVVSALYIASLIDRYITKHYIYPIALAYSSATYTNKDILILTKVNTIYTNLRVLYKRLKYI